MAKLRLVQERRQGEETEPSRTDLRNLGDAELFTASGIHSHLVVTQASDESLVADACNAYYLNLRPHKGLPNAFHLEVRNSVVGDHKKDSLRLLIAALEIHRKLPNARCALFQTSGLKALLEERIHVNTGAAQREEDRALAEIAQNTSGLSLQLPFAAIAFDMGMIPSASDSAWTHLSERQIDAVYATLSGDETVRINPIRKAK